jgi:hypothetical protein
MNQPKLVHVVNGVADLADKFEPLTRIQMMAFSVSAQLVTTDEFHREVRLRAVTSVCRSGVINLCYSRMLQTCER